MITKEVYEEQKALSDRWKTMYYEKKSEADQLTNNWNELEECIKKEMADGRSETNLWLMGCYDEDKKILDKMKEIKEHNND